jgi:hypothetical protein
MAIWSKRLAGLTGADCFILALDRMMKRRGQHGLAGQTHLLLESVPDLTALREGAARLCAEHPLLDAYVQRNPLTLEPSWRIEHHRKSNLPLKLWREHGSAQHPELDASIVGSAHELSEKILNGLLEEKAGLRNLRLDLILLRSGGSQLLLTWNHLLFDGKGAEFLASALISATIGQSKSPAKNSRIAVAKPLSLCQQIQKTRPVLDRFFNLVSNKYQSLSGPRADAGSLHYKLLQFTQKETESIHERATNLSGLYTVSFYIACAARAHRMAFLSRGQDPSHYVVSIPVQIRRKGGQNDPFQNCVTILFFCLQRDELESLNTAVASAQRQFEEMTRSELGHAFSIVLNLMRRLPARPYMKFLESQFAGEVTSFFHSSTGNFALISDELCGAMVLDAYHVPSVSAPPGSGLFFSEYSGRITATFSWRERSASEAEVDLILNQLRKDLIQNPSEVIG